MVIWIGFASFTVLKIRSFGIEES